MSVLEQTRAYQEDYKRAPTSTQFSSTHAIHSLSHPGVFCAKRTKKATCFLASRFFSCRSAGIRTRGLLVPNQTRYQTALHLETSQQRDSNPRPAVYETAALPTEPCWQVAERFSFTIISNICRIVKGFFAKKTNFFARPVKNPCSTRVSALPFGQKCRAGTYAARTSTGSSDGNRPSDYFHRPSP